MSVDALPSSWPVVAGGSEVPAVPGFMDVSDCCCCGDGGGGGWEEEEEAVDISPAILPNWWKMNFRISRGSPGECFKQ